MGVWPDGLANLHSPCTIAPQSGPLMRVNSSLSAKMFLAIALTTLMVVLALSAMVVLSMRDGFSRYLLQAEIGRFDDLVSALQTVHTQGDPGWSRLTADAAAWETFVGRNFRPERASPPGPLGGPLAPAPVPPQPKFAPPPPGAAPPLRPPKDTLALRDRLFLIAADGTSIIAGRDPGGPMVRRAIPDPQRGDEAVLGWLGLAAPGGTMGDTDSFFLREQYRALALAALVAVCLSGLAAALLSRLILAPLRSLEGGAKALAAGNYASRIPNRRADELGRLIDYYNTLAASLEAARAAERQWISDTSHELQTPLAILRAQIEALQDGVRTPSVQTLADTHEAVLRLSRLVDDIRILSFAAESAGFVRLRSADLSATLRRAVDAHRARLEEKGLTLNTDIAPDVTLNFDPDRIHQVIGNLLENALRYTTAPGTVEVILRGDGPMARLIVSDSAPAPAADKLPRLFDRFYRADASRDRASGGSGLGLSICKTIVTAHGGTLSAEPSALGGLTMTVALPKSKEAP